MIVFGSFGKRSFSRPLQYAAFPFVFSSTVGKKQPIEERVRMYPSIQITVVEVCVCVWALYPVERVAMHLY